MIFFYFASNLQKLSSSKMKETVLFGFFAQINSIRFRDDWQSLICHLTVLGSLLHSNKRQNLSLSLYLGTCDLNISEVEKGVPLASNRYIDWKEDLNRLANQAEHGRWWVYTFHLSSWLHPMGIPISVPCSYDMWIPISVPCSYDMWMFLLWMA